MRILFAADTFPPRCGGSGWSAFEQARGLIARGHEVLVVRPGERDREWVYENVPVVEWRFTRSRMPVVRHLQGRERLYTGFRKRLRSLIDSMHFDLVHAQHAATGPAAIEAAISTGLPTVVTIRDYWPVCLWGTKMSGSRRCEGCSYPRIVRCLCANSPLSAPIAPLAAPYVSHFLSRQRSIVSRADAVIAISNHIRATLRTFLPEGRVSVLPNFIEVPERPIEAVRQEPYLTFAGKFTAMKGIEELLEALRLARIDLPIHFIGDGPLKMRIEREIASGGIRGRVLGWLDRPKMLECMAGARFNLFPSRWDEPLGRVVIEAASVGRTSVILARPGTGPDDILEDGRSGVFARDVPGFAAAIRRLAEDPEQAERLGAAARQRVRDHFSPDAVLPRLEALYESARVRNRR